MPMETWDAKLSEASLERRRRTAKKRADQFVGRIPVNWISSASATSPTAAVVGIALWFKSGCEKSRTIRAGHSLWDRFNLSRFRARRGLLALESAGLVTVERHRGKNPVVTIIDCRGSATRSTEGNTIGDSR